MITTTTNRLAVAAIVLTATLLASQHSFAQGSLDELGETVNQDHLDLVHEHLSIWPPMNQELIETYNENLTQLIALWESESRGSEMSNSDVERLIDEAKKNEDIVKAKIDVAKKAEDEAEKERLELLKKSHEERRKYVERIRDIRKQEKKAAETRLDYLRSQQEVLRTGQQLWNQRGEAVMGERELMLVEKELIDKSIESAKLNDKLAGQVKDLNNKRKQAFEARQEMIEAMQAAGSE